MHSTITPARCRTILAGVLVALALLGAPSVALAQEHEAIWHASQLNSPPTTVEQTFVNPARTMTLAPKQMELAAGIQVTTKELFGLPLAYGYGLTDRLEIGADLSLFFHPFAAKALVSNVKAYGRYLMIPELLSLQGTFNVVGAIADPLMLSFEFDAPLLLKFLSDRIWLYVQPQLGFQYVRSLGAGMSSEFGMTFALGALGMYMFTDSIFADLEHQLSLVIRPEFAAPYADTPIPLGFGGGYLHRPTMTAFRLNLVFYNLRDFDQQGMGVMLTATQFLGGA